jgi:hypothetical protein
MAAGLALVVSLGDCGTGGHLAGAPRQVPAGQLRRSVASAYAFLDQMTDRYATGSTPRLIQSFTGGALGRQHFTASQTYDDALVIDAFLASGTAAERSKAVAIGDGLLRAQASDPRHDGRLRAAYASAPLSNASDVAATNLATLAGNMAWAGLALLQLHAATGRQAYLTGAEAIGNWVQAHCYDQRGPGGYTGGETAAGAAIPWKSTEHNIDLYAFFRLLAAQTRNPAWSARAAWARYFVTAMWDAPQRRFYVGTTADGFTPSNSLMPEDVNSWSYLALRDPRFAASVGWDVQNLAVAGRFRGVSFCRGDRSGVWFEGTAHLADALEFRGEPGDRAQAAQYLADIYYAQTYGPGADRRGIIAASRNGLTDCGGGTYYTSLHTGTTAWYILIAEKINPFALIPAVRSAVYQASP